MRSPGRWVVVGVLGFVALAVLVSTLAIRGISTDRKMLASHSLAPWVESLAAVDDALKARDVSAAMRAWHPVYAAALRDHGWEGLIAVGDARVRIERVAGSPRSSQGQARQIYLTALVRAQRQGSVEGAVRTASAFAALGDREVAAEAVRIAAALEKRRVLLAPSARPSL